VRTGRQGTAVRPATKPLVRANDHQIPATRVVSPCHLCSTDDVIEEIQPPHTQLAASAHFSSWHRADRTPRRSKRVGFLRSCRPARRVQYCCHPRPFVTQAVCLKETSPGRSHFVAAMPCTQWRIPVSQLLCSRPLDDWDERAVCRRDRCRGTVAQFITGYRQDALLFSRVPIGKRRAYDIES